MVVLLALLLLGLMGFCVISSEDLTNKRDLSVLSWIMAILFYIIFIGFLLIYGDHIKTESIKNYTEGKYQLEEVIYSDTTYVVKRKRNE